MLKEPLKLDFGAKEWFTLIIAIILITDLAVLLDVPVLRVVFGFLCYTILPGALILFILKLNKIEILSETVLHFKEFSLNGEKLKNTNDFIFDTEKRPHVLSYYFSEPGEFLEMSFSIPQHEKPELLLLEASYDLYKKRGLNSLFSDFTERTEKMIPKPFVLNDAIVVRRRISLD